MSYYHCNFGKLVPPYLQGQYEDKWQGEIALNCQVMLYKFKASVVAGFGKKWAFISEVLNLGQLPKRYFYFTRLCNIWYCSFLNPSGKLFPVPPFFLVSFLSDHNIKGFFKGSQGPMLHCAQLLSLLCSLWALSSVLIVLTTTYVSHNFSRDLSSSFRLQC